MSALGTTDLKKILAFHFLKEEELQSLLGICEKVSLEEGEVLLEEHEVSPFIYFIIDGAVNVMVENADRSQAYISILGQGEAFGEAGIFPQLERNATIKGAMRSDLIRIDRKKVLEFVSRNTAGGIKILMMIIYGLLKKLRGLNRELAFERKGNVGQSEVDSLVQDFMKQL